MPPQREFYPAKLLLFGEYTVLNGSQALAVPLNRWKGEWVKNESLSATQKRELSVYATWLQNQALIDDNIMKSMMSDVENGWYYQSDIPQGYGVGSSGALVAAMYDKYFPAASDIGDIHSMMAKMEGYFHGASSGLDPLISYTQKAVYKDEDGRFHAVENPGWPESYKVFLLDSGTGRETGPLVHQYKTKMQDPVFAEKIERQYIPMVEHALHFYLAGETKMLEECISVISQFQREYFTEMIPENVQRQWDELITMQGVYVKLCGAGGGGYFLVIAPSDNQNLSSSSLIGLDS